MLNIALVGVGYWGPNLARNLVGLGVDVSLAALCDRDQSRAVEIGRQYCPTARILSDDDEVAGDPDIDAVFVATPIHTHFELATKFLGAGKHVFVEKPLAETADQCLRLTEHAERKGLVLMVGHIFEFNSVVQEIKRYLDAGELGKLFYINAQRVNLGRIQRDINAMWSLAPHDISIVNYWLGAEPLSVSANGFSFVNSVEDTIFLNLTYPDGVGVHLHVSWLNPRKLRLMTLVGSRKMLVYDDVSIDSKLTIYDKGVSDLDEFMTSPDSFAEFQVKLRTGDVTIPAVPYNEPLANECRHFVECITEGKRPLTDGLNAMRVVKVLEAAQRSLEDAGRTVEIEPSQ